MSFGKVVTSSIVGIDGRRVLVEADFGDGLPTFDMVGFLSSEVREARERVRAALKNTGIELPPGRLTVNLSPADLRKQGNAFDLPIAVAIMIAVGILPESFTEGYTFIGELSLDGRLRGIEGTLSHAIAAGALKQKGCIVPAENAAEGAMAGTVAVFGFETLSDVIDFLLGNLKKDPEPMPEMPNLDSAESFMDFSEISGQESLKRAVEVACAGMHGLLMIGPPGTGKSMTAKRIPTILPPLTKTEQLETSRIHSVAGILDRSRGMVTVRPFRNPHHTVSSQALVGGGIYPKPGEMSLAHNGVLFLDELTEFSRATLDSMRQPLEDQRVVISRVHGTYVFPTRVMLVCAMNPCKCGYYPDRNKCRCSEREVRMYLGRISRPFLDRIDISAEVPRVTLSDIAEKKNGESSREIRRRVIRAWEIQKERYKNEGIVFNSQLEGRQIRKYCRLGKEEEQLMKDVFDRLDFSARAYDRILKVARTIADLAEEEYIGTAHLAEAIGYRSLDRNYLRGE